MRRIIILIGICMLLLVGGCQDNQDKEELIFCDKICINNTCKMYYDGEVPTEELHNKRIHWIHFRGEECVR